MNYRTVVKMLRDNGFSEPRPSGTWWRNETERLAAELLYDPWTDTYSIRVEAAL